MKLSQRCFPIFCVIIFNVSCNKLIDVDPPYVTVNSGTVYSSDETAAAVLTGIYTNLSKENSTLFGGFSRGGLTSLSLFPGLSSDELVLYDYNNPLYSPYFKNSLTGMTTGSADYWKSIYPIVFVTNSAIEGLTASNRLMPSVKKHLLGEAKFVRAFCYFYLVNLYGDVPLITTTDWQTNSSLSRVTSDQVYAQIILDLKEADTLMQEKFLGADIQTFDSRKSQTDKMGCKGSLARVYMYTSDWLQAENMSSQIIAHTSLFTLASLNEVFLANSSEAIWQLQAIGSGANSNTGEEFFLFLPSEGPETVTYPVYLNENIYKSMSIEDKRKNEWISYAVRG